MQALLEKKPNNKAELVELKRRKLDLLHKKMEVKYRNLYWAKYVHVNTKGQRMNWQNRDFLVDIYKAVATERQVVVMKSVQCGVSEAFVVTHLEQAERGLSVLYILPKTDLRNRFVDNRIDRTILRVPKYRSILASSLGSADSKSLKMFGRGVINYVPSNSPANFTEFPADVIYYDEKDKMDQSTILLARDRLSDSQYKFERMVSNPTITEYGIAYDYDASSKGVRMFKCSHCGEWQAFDFFSNVVKQTGKRDYDILDKDYNPEDTAEAKVYCVKCMKPIERFGVQQEWVHARPTADSRGFHISKMFSPQGTVKDLIKRLMECRHNETKFQVFLNSDLGLPMSGAGVQITREDIIASRGNYQCSASLPRAGVRYAGVDVGNDLHMIIREWDGTRKRLVWKGKLRGEADIIKAMRDFGVRKLVVDALPELRMVERLKELSSDVYNCFFGVVKETSANKKDRIMTARRTLVIDRVKENYERSVYLNPLDILDDKEYMSHVQSNIRVADADTGEFMWLQKSNRPDHYLLAEGYCDLAGDMAIGYDILSMYKGLTADSISRDKVPTTAVNVVDELEQLPEAEKERIKKKQNMDANQFFNDIMGNSW